MNRLNQLGVLLLTALLIAACDDSGREPNGAARGNAPPQAVRVIAEPVQFLADVERVEAVGTARARQSAEIYAEAGGEVTAVHFDAGAFTEQGAVLATLENASERLSVARAEVALDEARQLLGRYERIDVPGAVSDSQIDTAKAAVRAARIELDLARDILAQREIRAPFAGHLGIPAVDQGGRIGTDTMITTLDDRSVLYVDFDVPEQVFGMITPGDTLPMIPFTTTRSEVRATVQAVGSRIDPDRRAFTVRAAIDNADDSLRPGMSFRVALELTGERLPAIPEAAIVWGGDGAYLWAVTDGTVTRVPVTIVSRREGTVLVSADIKEGQPIIAEGVQKVREGVPIENIELDAPPRGVAVPASSAISGAP